MLTETDEVAAALRDAARRWPKDRERPAKLLLDLVREGHRAIAADEDRATARRRAAIKRTSGEALAELRSTLNAARALRAAQSGPQKLSLPAQDKGREVDDGHRVEQGQGQDPGERAERRTQAG